MDGKPEHILKIFLEGLPKDWNQAGALLENMPDDVIYSLNRDFFSLSREDRFAEIVKYGHGEAAYVINNLRNGLSPPRFKPDIRRNQYPMPKLREDLAAVEILQKASRLRAKLDIENFPYAVVRY